MTAECTQPGRDAALPMLDRDADALLAVLDRWQGRRVLVIGDYMLDRTTFGNAERLSPDAPVPVLATERQTHAAGGASNVCLDLAALRCEVHCVGVVGDDTDGRLLRQTLAAAGCDADGLVTAADRPSTVKHSFVGLAQHRHPQKMFRVDSESTAPIDAATERQLIAQVQAQLGSVDVLCIEDYHKGAMTPGVCRAVIDAARCAGVAVLVDPAAIDDYGKYGGATCITPNRTEAARATGTPFEATDDPAVLLRMATTLRQQLRLEAVMLTLDKRGLLLASGDDGPKLAATRARGVYDVTGAGDMVLAVAAAARANGIDWPNATHLANTAAGLEVEKFGVVPIALEELQAELLSERHEQAGKIRTLAQLLPELAQRRGRGQRVVFTNGCFDLLHAGHVSYLRDIARQADVLVVGLNNDASVRAIKGELRPVNVAEDRATVLSELECVDYVVVFDEPTPLRLIEAIRPDVLAKGGDYDVGSVVGREAVEASGGEIYLAPLLSGRSTTALLRKIARGTTSPPI